MRDGPRGQIGPYALVAEVGRGATGAVWRARSPDGRDVALKLLLTALDPERRGRFAREVRLQDALGEAEGFVPLLDAGDSPQGPYLVMPFLAGGTLRGRLARGPLAVEEARALGRALGIAIGAAHARGIVHRDLKPENVLFAAAGSAPLVADLGIAKHFRLDAPGASQTQFLSSHGELRGTVGYMAPEQLEDARTAGPPADVFALGAILYECLAGVPAFVGESPLDVLGKIGECRVVPLRKLRADVPAPLAAAIDRALMRDPAARFADGIAFARALAARPRGRRGAAIVLGFGATLAIAVASLAVLRALRPHRPEGTARPAPVGPAAPVASRTRSPEVVRLVSRANDRIQALDLDAAQALVDGALALDSTDAAAWTASATVKLNRRDAAAAVGDFEHALRLDGRHVMAWVGLGSALMVLNRKDDAYVACERAIQLGSTAASPYLVRGEIRRGRKDADGAIADFTEAFARDRRMLNALRSRGFAYREKGDVESARDDLERYLESVAANDPMRPHAVRALAEIGPPTVATHIRRAERYVDEAAYGRAADEATKALALDGRCAEALFLRGVARKRNGEYGAAETDIGQALELDPKHAKAWNVRALLSEHAQEWAQQVRHATRAIEEDPKFAIAYSTRGTAQFRLGKLDEAVADFEKALALDPKLIDTRSNLATAWMTKGDHRRAIAQFDRAIELDPRHAPSYSNRGALKLDLGMLDEAIADATRALELDARVGQAWVTRGVAREKRGETADAIADYEKYLELNLDAPEGKVIRQRLARLKR